jgi:hypothetical protein
MLPFDAPPRIRIARGAPRIDADRARPHRDAGLAAVGDAGVTNCAPVDLAAEVGTQVPVATRIIDVAARP